ncbi:MAG: ATP-binding cassette domain-containing protein [Eggerthella lenta]
MDWIIGPGDRYGIVGKNGTEQDHAAACQVCSARTGGEDRQTVRFAVLSHLDDLPNWATTVCASHQPLQPSHDAGRRRWPRQLLEKLGFKRADLNEPVKDLSGGQKRRLALMLILLDEPNVLILDEPGNDLDTDMLAVVEDLLDAWPGTLLLVTHDRYLMERVTDHQFALVNGKIRHLPGGVDEYLRLSDASPSSMAAGSPARQRPAHAADSGLSGTEASPESSRLSGGEQRTLRKLMQSNERKVETLNGKIEDVRASMAAADPTDFTALGDFQAQISDLQQQIDALEEEWMEAAEKLGE